MSPYLTIYTTMKQYLYLPHAKCKNCKHLDESCVRSYKCFDENCPAHSIGIVVEDSVCDLANKYKTAVANRDLHQLQSILQKVQSNGRAFEYKFKQEIKK